MSVGAPDHVQLTLSKLFHILYVTCIILYVTIIYVFVFLYNSLFALHLILLIELYMLLLLR